MQKGEVSMVVSDHFITKLHISKINNMKDINIALSDEIRKHLILTGKNGSGKTTLLNALKTNLLAINEGHWAKYKKYESENGEIHSKAKKNIIDNLYGKYLSGVEATFNSQDTLEDSYANGSFVTAFFPAHRQSQIVLAHGVEEINLSSAYKFDDNPAELLIKYMVHLKTQQAYARQENDSLVEHAIKEWFERFQRALGELLDDESIKLEYDYKKYNFLIHQKGKMPFGFTELSDGYSSVIRIVADLILRMEQNWLLKGNVSNYEMEGVALIDELETHLHIELQRKILPFLTTFFPRIQFIVTTHSPYILTSIPNAVIYDLEKHVTFTDMTNYSVDDVAEAFFNAEDYSLRMGEMLQRYRDLLANKELTEAEMIEKTELAQELKNVPGKLATRIQNEFSSIEG